MWIPDYVILKNLQTHEDTKFVFQRGETVMIEGKNEFVSDNQKSNGSGKSGIIEAVALAFLGEPVRKVRLQELVRDNEKSAELELALHNSISSDRMLIKRKFYANNTPSKLTFDMNDKPIEMSGVAHGTTLILEQLGISKEDLLNYYVVSKKQYTSFYYAKDKDNKALISRFSKSDRIDGIFDTIKTDITYDSDEVDKLDVDANNIEGQKTAYTEQLEGIVDPKVAKKAAIEAVDKQIGVNEGRIKDCEIDIETQTKLRDEIRDVQIKDNEKEIKDLKNKRDVIAPDNETTSKLAKDLTDVNQSIARHEDNVTAFKEQAKEYEGQRGVVKTERDAYDKLKTEIETTLAGEIECPQCKLQFVVDENVDVAEAKKMIGEISTEIEIRDKVMEELDADVIKANESVKSNKASIVAAENDAEKIKKTMNADKERIHELNGEIKTIERATVMLETDIDTKDKKIKQYHEDIVSYKDMIKEGEIEKKDIVKRSATNNRQELEDKLTEIEGKLADKAKERAKADNKVMEKTRLLEHFKQFKSFLANKSLKAIELRTNDSLSKLGSTLSIAVSGFTSNRDKSIREDISIGVYRNGILRGSFGKFSEGEKAKMDISTILGNQELINMSTDSGGLDLLMTDEITESVDAQGVGDILAALNKIDKTICVITHASNDEVKFANVVTIVKNELGISKIA